MLWAHIFDGTEILIPVPQITVCEVEVGVLCDGNTAVSQNPAEGVNVHTVHQTPFCEVISQSMRGVGLINASPSKIPFESGFKGMDFQRKSGLLRKKKFAVGIPILVT